jgi:hypothetical protein
MFVLRSTQNTQLHCVDGMWNFFSVKPVGTYSDHWALEDYV